VQERIAYLVTVSHLFFQENLVKKKAKTKAAIGVKSKPQVVSEVIKPKRKVQETQKSEEAVILEGNQPTKPKGKKEKLVKNVENKPRK